MAEIASAYVSLLPSAQGFGSKLNSQIGPQVNRSGTVAGAGFGRAMLKGFIAIGVITKLTQFVGDAFSEAREAQKVSALVDNAIKQTGGVANVTAAQIDRLSAAFSRKTGIDDEQIATSAALLLTFKNVRDAGTGLENIFNRATRASADLSASGFGSMDSAAKQLGKALNDPIKGVTALARAGVTFSESQKEQIKGFVETGRLLQAQKVILAEVESQVGGSAVATATDADKASVAMGNLKEQIGTALLPAMNSLSRGFTNTIAPAISGFITNLQSGEGSAGRFATIIRESVIPAARDIFHWFAEVVAPSIKGALVDALEQGRKAFDIIREAVRANKPELTQMFNAFKKIAEFFYTKVVPAVYAVASRALPVLATAISGIIRFASDMVRGFNAIKGALQVVNNVVGAAIAKFQAFKTDVTAAAKAAKAAISRYIGAALGPINSLIAALTTAISKFNELRGKKSGGVKGGSGTMADLGRVSGRSFSQSLADGISAKGGEIDKKTRELVKRIRGTLSGLKSDFASLVEPIASAFTDNLFESETGSGFIANLLGTKGQLTALKDAFQKLLGWGLSPGFLSQLFASGNGGLILDLAAGSKDQAAQAGSLFGEVNSLAQSLGTSVAGSTQEGQALIKGIDRLEGRLEHLTKAVQRIGGDVGREINGAARGGRRLARVA